MFLCILFLSCFIFNIMKTVETSVPCEPLTRSLCSWVTSWWTKVGKDFKAWISQCEAECPLSYWVTNENAITASSLAGLGLLWVVRSRLFSLWLHLVNGWWWMWEQITARHCCSPIRTVSCVFIHRDRDVVEEDEWDKERGLAGLKWCALAASLACWGDHCLSIPSKAHRQDPWDTSGLDPWLDVISG